MTSRIRVLQISLVLLAGVSLSAKQAEADPVPASGAAPLYVGAIAAHAAVGSAVYEALLTHELPDWKDEATATSGSFTHQCGASVELRVIGFHNRNLLLIALKNETAQSVLLRLDELEMHFSTGRTRIPDFDSASGEREVKPQGRVFGAAPFPNKADFKDADWIDVKIPLAGTAPCTIQARLQRNVATAPHEETFTERTAFEMVFGGGSSFWRAGNLASLGVPSVSLEAQIEGYLSLRHGYFLRFLWEGFGGGNAGVLAPALNGLSGSPGLRAVSVMAGYSHRIPLGERWFVFLGGGAGLYSFLYSVLNTSGVAVGGESDTLVLNARASVAFRFLKVTRGFWRGNYYVDLAIYDQVLPFGAVGSVPASGNAFGATLGLRLGG